MITAILGFIVTTGILVFVHEYGHYAIAKFYGVKIEEFSIGFGKEIVHFIDKAKVKWKICLIPLGGYVKMYKDENFADNNDYKARDSEEFYAKPPYQRLLIILSGPIANFLLAFILLTGFYNGYGKITISNIIEKVIANSPAEAAGLLAGDTIISVQDNDIADFVEFKQYLALYPTLPIKLTINRNNEILDIFVTSYIEGQGSTPRLGIQSFPGKRESLNIFESAYFSGSDIYNISKLTLQMLSQMLFGKRSSDGIHGPVTIAKESANSIQGGVANFVAFIALISVNLGLINILPIPILDGGHALFTIYEIILNKPLRKNLQNLFNKIGLAIIIFLIIISTTNDIRDLLT